MSPHPQGFSDDAPPAPHCGLRDPVSKQKLLVVTGIAHEGPATPGRPAKEEALLRGAADLAGRTGVTDECGSDGVRVQRGPKCSPGVRPPRPNLINGRGAGDQ